MTLTYNEKYGSITSEVLPIPHVDFSKVDVTGIIHGTNRYTYGQEVTRALSN